MTMARVALVADDAEESVLSAMMAHVDAIEEVRALDLRAADFSDRNCAVVFRAMMALHDRGSPVDPVTLCAQLNGTLESVGGKDYVGYLIDVVPTAANVRYHAEIVLGKAKSRGLAGRLEENAKALRDGTALPAQVAMRLRPALDLLGSDANGLPTYDDEEILALPPIDFLVDGVLPASGACEMHGPPGVGKSFVALDLALSIASAHEFFGRAVSRATVLYVAAEGSAGLPNRVRAWKTGRGVSGRLGVRFITEPINLLDADNVSRFLATARADKLLGFVVFDTLARCMVGGDENSAQDMGRAIDSVDRIRRETGACVMLVHHTRKDGEVERGSTALRGALDAMLAVKGDDGELSVICEKMKDAPPFETIRLHLAPQSQSCVLVGAGNAPHLQSDSLTPKELTALTSLQRSFLSEGATASEWFDASGLPKRTFYDARTSLVRAIIYLTHPAR